MKPSLIEGICKIWILQSLPKKAALPCMLAGAPMKRLKNQDLSNTVLPPSEGSFSTGIDLRGV